MIQLIYISCATREMSEKDLFELLQQSRIKNEKCNVTGLLLYAKENFMQVLEGDEVVVDDIYQSILKDERNTLNSVLQRKHIEKRSFPSWSMGFKTIDDIPPQMMNGFSNFLMTRESKSHLELEKNRVLSLLNSFKVCTDS
ncbi:BLUF domain-containing protein [Thalassotalea castellviae]|uniref:BLUF domain-containing protein n=1 Tax=Thalassotalea castellviae TaxID=3075612 RepID=A0ABU3A354_9GAMM|nr:BLUF domain-containing protein [Thalassotalea sp. W431]MDT0604596.1 BLUF domain-containing protein [Thalassotalea sp. W431]